jgi:hypothetical protein
LFLEYIIKNNINNRGNNTGKNMGNKIMAANTHIPNSNPMRNIQKPANKKINKIPIEIAQIDAASVAHAPPAMTMAPPMMPKNTYQPARQINITNKSAVRKLNIIDPHNIVGFHIID